MHKLVLMRHGQSQWNLENRFTGWTPEDKVRDEFESIKALLDSEIKDVLERSED